MKVRIKKFNDEAILPKYAYQNDAGMDLFSVESLILKPGQKILCKTGIAMAIPIGYVGLIWDKSGVATSEIKVMGGVIDSGYHGEIKIILKNLSRYDYKINKKDKIAQMLIQKIEIPELKEVEDLEKTSRGSAGFGSTGITEKIGS